MKKTLMRLVVAFICFFNFAKASEIWISAEGIVSAPGTAATGNDVGGSSLNAIISSLKSNASSSQWKVYYNNSKSGTPIFPDTSKTGIFLYAGVSSGKSVYSTAYTKFALSEEVSSADKAKISFDLEYYGTGSAIGFQLNVGGWDEVEVPIGLGRSLDFSSLSYEPSASFSFGLVNLATNEVYEASVSTSSDTYKLSANSADLYLFDAGEDGIVTVSFELDAEQLETITAAGLGLLVKSESSGALEGYVISNFSVEYLLSSNIPEPAAFAAVFGAVCLLAAIRRKRK